MAINKNFVIKNGVQVSTNLIVGDSTTNKVGIGTTVPGYTLHVGGSRGGIGATDLNVTGVGTVKDLLVSGYSGFSSDVSVSGIVSAQSFGIGTTEVIDRGMRLSGIASLDATTIATIESAIKSGPNIFDDLKVLGISTFVGVTTFLGGIDVNVRSGVSTFSAPVQFGIAPIDGQAGLSSNFVAVGATVGFGTSAFFRDHAGLFFGDDSDLKISHGGSNSYIDEVGTGSLFVQTNGNSIVFQKYGTAERLANFYIDGSVELFFDASKKLETTSGGLKVTGITTLTDRLHVQAGVSTFDADVRYGIGATVGFGTSAFFLDDAAIFLGDDSDLKIHHDGSNSYIEDVGTGDLILKGSADIKLQSASGENYLIGNDTGSVEQYFDNSKKTETTSGGFKVTGITTLTDRLHVQSGISTFDADVRYGIGATVGFGTSAFFRDDAAIFLGNDSDLKIVHDGGNSRIVDNGTGNLCLQTNLLNIYNPASTETLAQFTADGSVDLYFDNSKKVETTSGGFKVTGITTLTDRLFVEAGISTFVGDVRFGIGATVGFGTSAFFKEEAGLFFGDDSDLKIHHSLTNSYIDEVGTGSLFVQTNGNSIVFQKYGTAERLANFYVDGSVELFYDATKTFETTPQGINVSGVTTSNRLIVSGVSTFSGDVNIGGNLSVTGDIVYDEVTGRNINISGMTTLGSSAGGGVIVTPVGAGATVGNANGAGIVTYYGDGAYLQNLKAGVGIGSTTGLVGYGFTYIHFNGPGVSTVYADARPDFVGYATVFIQGGGGSSVGAAGTWTPEGSIGISTSKSVGINTVALNDPDVQGIGNSFQGLYIGNGMMMFDNALNGDHYIGTSKNGMMSGPVTINGVLTVDGNYVVV